MNITLIGMIANAENIMNKLEKVLRHSLFSLLSLVLYLQQQKIKHRSIVSYPSLPC